VECMLLVACMSCVSEGTWRGCSAHGKTLSPFAGTPLSTTVGPAKPTHTCCSLAQPARAVDVDGGTWQEQVEGLAGGVAHVVHGEGAVLLTMRSTSPKESARWGSDLTSYRSETCSPGTTCRKATIAGTTYM
jgi:hypothetical protein